MSLNEKGANRVSVAVCDPRTLVSALIQDERVYKEKEISLRLVWDPHALSTLLHASFVFDTLVAQLPFLVGLKEVLGYSFLELFGKRLEDLKESGFVSPDASRFLEDDVLKEIRALAGFLEKIHKSELEVARLSGFQWQNIHIPIEHSLLYCSKGGLPFIGTESLSDSRASRSLPADVPVNRAFAVIHDILELELPGLNVASLGDIIEIRNTQGAQEFRAVVREIVDEITLCLNDDPSAIHEAVPRWNRRKQEATDLLAREYKSDVSSWSVVKAGFSALLNIAGIVPGVAFFSTSAGFLKDGFEFTRLLQKRKRLHRTGFLSFLAELRTDNQRKNG